MFITVNEETVPEELIAHEAARLAILPGFQGISDEHERAVRVRAIAESAVVDRILIRQIAELDQSPVDPAEIEKALDRYRQTTGCGPQVNDPSIRAGLEGQLRIARTRKSLIGDVPPPQEVDVEAFYHAHKHNFKTNQTAHCSHVVVNIDKDRAEPEAKELIEQALRELEAGVPFAGVADRYSDCKGAGGALKPFPKGEMVPEFEDVVFNMEAGTRSGVFRTPFGYHIAQLHSKSEATPCSIDVVGPEIRAYLTARAEHERMQRAMQYLRANSKIVSANGKAANG